MTDDLAAVEIKACNELSTGAGLIIPFDQIALATSARFLPCVSICNEKFAAAVRCERRLMNAHARMRRKAKGFHWCALAADDMIVECRAVASGEAEKRISF